MEDSCQIYVRTKAGSLARLVVSHIRDRSSIYAQSKQKHFSDNGNYNDVERRMKILEFRKPPPCNRKTLLSLRESCLRLVAFNICLVDSWINFPDDIAKEILAKAIQLEAFENSSLNDLVPLINAFQDAYPKLIMTTCKITDLILINEYDNLLDSMLVNILELDLSGCQLGDNHDLLRTISKLQYLKKLNLSNNCLSDTGIRTLAEGALMTKSWKNLFYMDLSQNQVSPKALLRCHKISSLMVVIVSIPTTKKNEFSQEVLNKFEPSIPHVPLPFSSTSGWAVEIFELMNQKLKKIESFKSRREKPSFYSHAPKSPLVLLKRPEDDIILVCYNRVLPTSASTGCKKRKLNNSCAIPIAINDENDDDILSMYK